MNRLLLVLLLVTCYFTTPVTAAPSHPISKDQPKDIFSSPDKLNELIQKTVEAASDQSTQDLHLPVEGRITSIVGMRRDPINGIVRMHRGIDIAIPEGTPVHPVAPGRVMYSGHQPGYGNMVMVRHDDGMITIYAHHSRNLSNTGDRVEKATTIAISGSTGHSTGPHLHFEAWQAGVNVTRAYLPSFHGKQIKDSPETALSRTRLRTIVLSDGTVVLAEISGKN